MTSMLGRIVGAAVGFALLALVYGALERAFPARPAERWPGPSWRTDACFYFGQYLVFGSAAVLVLSAVSALADAHRPAALGSAFATLSPWLQGGVCVVLGDFCVYWFHRACHRFDFLWRFHAVHHSVERLDWLAAHREHPVDGILTQICQNLPAMVLGLRIETLAVLIAFRGAWAIFVHANVRLPLGPLALFLGAPELHHWHHARTERTRHNFANLAPWIDVVFGTHHRPEGAETYALGLTEPWPRGYLAQLAKPLGLERGTRHSRKQARFLQILQRSRPIP